MTQNEVYDYLKKQRDLGNHEFISINTLYRALLDMKTASCPSRRSVWRNIQMLKKYKYVETRGFGGWPAYIRLKKHIIDEVDKNK